MPSVSQLTTAELVDIIRGATESNYTAVECGAELFVRMIPMDDVSASNTEYRGGIRPTHAPTH